MAALQQLKEDLHNLGSPQKAEKSARFFKTGKGGYSEGDFFIGITMPELRKVIKSYYDIPLDELEVLLHSKEHEYRMAALLILVHRFKKGDIAIKRECYELYLSNTFWVNNWDLVDASAEFIVGPWLQDEKEKKAVLFRLAGSKSLWERRIAMLSTFAYIKNGRETEAFRIAELLLEDKEDLIHKAVGWMLRETGKRCSQEVEEVFLRKYYKKMPRTMLRYAIEHFPEAKRKAYLKGEIK